MGRTNDLWATSHFWAKPRQCGNAAMWQWALGNMADLTDFMGRRGFCPKIPRWMLL